MTIVSDDPSWWPLIELNLTGSYLAVVCFAVVVYDWALAFGQEIELVWEQRCKWSFMNVIYLSVVALRRNVIPSDGHTGDYPINFDDRYSEYPELMNAIHIWLDLAPS
ncbi:hypothetical protein M405DRAFT_868776 [Rhizopogon salebrosus TDB-379]|nr:hypothetical protein M405DRAFT_868776 [Rhizopogon salebrosus TDB-379]